MARWYLTIEFSILASLVYDDTDLHHFVPIPFFAHVFESLVHVRDFHTVLRSVR